MQESIVICPVKDNDGNPLYGVKTYAVRNLVKYFGGCTIRQAEGYWMGPDGTLYQEPVWELVAAYEPNEDNDRKLLTVAALIGAMGKQEAVYMKYAGGRVEILDTSEKAQPAMAAA